MASKRPCKYNPHSCHRFHFLWLDHPSWGEEQGEVSCLCTLQGVTLSWPMPIPPIRCSLPSLPPSARCATNLGGYVSLHESLLCAELCECGYQVVLSGHSSSIMVLATSSEAALACSVAMDRSGEPTMRLWDLRKCKAVGLIRHCLHKSKTSLLESALLVFP